MFHHGPEDLAIAAIKFTGALAILIHIDPWLTLIVFSFLPFMAAYAEFITHKNKKLGSAGQLESVRASLTGQPV
jgi:ATP-binding cassette subfamily B protein